MSDDRLQNVKINAQSAKKKCIIFPTTKADLLQFGDNLSIEVGSLTTTPRSSRWRQCLRSERPTDRRVRRKHVRI